MNRSTFPKADVLAACAKYGPQLRVEATLDGNRVMAAIASNESSYGANCGPRHETTYDVGGRFATSAVQQALLKEYGSAAACSYGPWQMMFGNFAGCNPGELLSDLDLCASMFVRWFNLYVIGARHAQTLQDIGQVWNAGHKMSDPAPGVKAYCDHLQDAYDLA